MLSWLKRLSLRARLLILFGLVSALLVADRTSEIVNRRAELVGGVRERLVDLAKAGAERHSDLMSDVQALLTLAAEMPEASASAGLACRRPFEKTVAALPWLKTLIALRPDGRAFCGSFDLPAQLNAASRPYFKDVLATRGFVLSGYLRTQTDSEPALLAALPRIVDGQVDSVVVARLDLAWLNGVVARASERSGLSVVLADQSGTVVTAWPDPDNWTGRPLSALGLPMQGAWRPNDVAEALRGGEAWIYAVAGLPQTGGRLFVGAHRDAVLGPVEWDTWKAVLKVGLALALCAAGLWFGADWAVARPMRELAEASARFGHGDLDARVDPAGFTPEIESLARAFNGMAAQLAERERDLRAANGHLAKLATVDALTGLANRRHFDERLAQEWRRAVRTGRPLGAVLIDIDAFKAFNDTYGHVEGDACLRLVAGVIGVEHRPDDLAARMGGEEFVILLPGADQHRSSHVARLVRLEIEALRIPHSGSPIGVVTISAGATSISAVGGDSVGDLIRTADEALYRAKRAGRNRVAVRDLGRSSDRPDLSEA